MASESCKFKYVCRGCGEGWFFPPSEARCDWSGQDMSRVGVYVGTAMGGAQSSDDGYQMLYGEQSDRIKPFSVLLGMHNAPAAWIAGVRARASRAMIQS